MLIISRVTANIEETQVKSTRMESSLNSEEIFSFQLTVSYKFSKLNLIGLDFENIGACWYIVLADVYLFFHLNFEFQFFFDLIVKFECIVFLFGIFFISSAAHVCFLN